MSNLSPLSLQTKDERRAVGIIGGMGPAAGADFLRIFLQACETLILRSGLPLRDQSYPEHWLAQVPVPDRLEIKPGDPTPQERIIETLDRMQNIGIRAVAIACNTAHTWHEEYRKAFPDLEILHIAREAIAALSREGARRIGVMATSGTHQSMLYETEAAALGIQCFTPNELDRSLVMRGIFEGVKKGDIRLATQCFEGVARRLVESYDVDTVLLACTEIPLALSAEKIKGVRLINPAQALAVALSERAMASVTPLAPATSN